MNLTFTCLEKYKILSIGFSLKTNFFHVFELYWHGNVLGVRQGCYKNVRIVKCVYVFARLNYNFLPFFQFSNNLLNCGIKTRQCVSILNVSVSQPIMFFFIF